jgi:inosine/xanthosine triphosphate pyrophosphatase family protein
MGRLITVTYVTSSPFKVEENRLFSRVCLIDGNPVESVFSFDIRPVQIKEVLEVDIAAMVCQEVVQAYKEIRVPCIVEHAGLVFEDSDPYPGGLTKPMWNTLGDRFLAETGGANKRAKARAVIAYCDGQRVLSFCGETAGVIADQARGSREFYWDTVFIPDTTDPCAIGKTYAEIADDPSLGLDYKIRVLSQSSRAMLKFLEYRRNNTPTLWPRS